MSRSIADPQRNHFAAVSPPQHLPTARVPASFLEPLEPSVELRLRGRSAEVLHALKNLIGDPFFAEDGYILYCGDAIDILARLARSPKPELVVTSPPYNIGKEYETPKPLSEFVSWCADWLQLIHSCSASTGTLWLNLGYISVPGRGTAVPLAYLLWDKSSFHFLQEVVWVYGAGVAAKRRLSPRNEKWLFLTKAETQYTFNLDAIRDPNVKYPNQKKNGRYRCNPLGKNPSDVWTIPKVTTGAQRSSKERTGHPAQFPLEVVERIVLASSNVGELVLDPFAGSGSTGIAAVAHGRVYLGIELREDYCALAVERFRRLREHRQQHAAQGALFLSSE